MKKLIFLLGITLSVLATSCSRDELIQPVYPIGDGESYERVVIIYMVAQNSLDSYSVANMNQIMQGLSNATPGKRCAVVAYVDPRTTDSGFPELGNVPRVVEMVMMPDRSLSRNVVKVYSEQDSTDPAIMQSALDDIMEMYPAEEYGLMLWGHGSGWLYRDNPPANIAGDGPKHAFGDDNNHWMNLDMLATALPDDTFGFIIFDVCFMGSVEVVYQLRDKADYIIAAPTEVMAGGYPYERIIPRFFQYNLDLPAICSDFYNYYSTHPRNAYGTVSLTKTSELPALAGVVKGIISSNGPAIRSLNTDNLQAFGQYSNNIDYDYSIFHDLGDFIENIATSQQYAAFQAQMDKTVLYKAHTPRFIYIPINKFSGLSSYIYKGNATTQDNYYRSLDWYDAVWKGVWLPGE